MRWSLVIGLVVLAVSAATSRAALPLAYGGSIRLAAASEVNHLDPTAIHDPFEASLAAAVFDTLYSLGPNAEPRPVLAADLPSREGDIVTIRMRTDVRRHRGLILDASMAAQSLRRAGAAKQAGWVLAGVARRDGALDIEAVGSDTLRFGVTVPEIDLATRLAAAPLAITLGSRSRRDLDGTGSFSFASRPSDSELRSFRHSVSRAPFLERIVLQRPTARDATLRAFELGQIDGTWLGPSLYGGSPARPIASARGLATAPVLLVPRNDLAQASWSPVVHAVDRRRLARVGLLPTDRIADVVPPTQLPQPPRRRTPMTLVLLLRAEDPFERRLGESLTAILDEQGVTLRTETLPESAYQSALRQNRYDLRLATVLPPLPGTRWLIGAVLAACDRPDAAHAVALATEDHVLEHAASVPGIVLGRRQTELFHRADLVNARYDTLGRLRFADLSLLRPANQEGAP